MVDEEKKEKEVEERELENDKELLELSEFYQMLKEDAFVLAVGLRDSVRYFLYLSAALIIIGLVSTIVSILIVMQGISLAGTITLISGILVILLALSLWRYYSNMIHRFSTAKLLD